MKSLIVSIVILLGLMISACGISEKTLIKHLSDDAPITRTYQEFNFSNDQVYKKIIADALVRSGYKENDEGRFFCLSVFKDQGDTICIIHYRSQPIDFSEKLDWDNKKNLGYTTLGNHYFLIRGDKKYFKSARRLPHSKEFNLYKSYYVCIYDPEYLCYVIKGSTFNFLTYSEYIATYYPEEIFESIPSDSL